MSIEHLNPDSMHRNPAFSQVVVARDAKTMVFVGGQNAIAKDGSIVGDDLRTQTQAALKNVLLALESVGATQADVVRLGIHIVQGQPIAEGFAAAQEVWGRHATAITVLVVAGLANPRFLVEVEATAALS